MKNDDALRLRDQVYDHPNYKYSRKNNDLLFSERLQLAQKYREWLKEHPEVKDCALSVITFMVSRGLIRREKVEGVMK